MNRSDFIVSIRHSWDFTNGLKLAQTFSAPHPLPVEEEFRKVILSSESTYLEVYKKAVELRHYNFILNDYSFFQFSMNADEYRYAFYPNPYKELNIGDMFADVKNGLMELEEYLQTLSFAKPHIGSPLIRYEYSPSQYKEILHPCAHFHIGFHSENRWQVAKILTPYVFSLYVLKQYYPDEWSEHGDDDADELKNTFNSLLATERQRIPAVSNTHFSLKDKKIFFWD